MNDKLISIIGIMAAVLIALAIAIGGSMGGLQVSAIPLLLISCVFSFLVQWLAFIPAFIYQTEKYYDLVGSITYLSLVMIALFYSRQDPGNILIALMVTLWAARLGTFLFLRIRNVGHDTRFRKIKPDFLKFLMTWTLQGLWVFFTFAAGLAAMTSGNPHPFDVVVAAGCLIWLVGFMIEVIADKQKANFRKDPAQANNFIRHGLWAWSRHPNYFGEILLWTGIAVAALPSLQGWQHISLISPIFVYVLLTKISGVRMLEARANRRWGDDPEYITYRDKTPVLMLNPTLKGIGT
jgi:steroid 5-alpha reductase family enzyme